MNKYLFSLIFSLLLSGLVSCNDEKDVSPINVNLFTGTWEIILQDNPGQNDIYCISITDLRDKPYGEHYGIITTFRLTSAGNPTYDKEYAWSIRETENHQPMLELRLTGELDSDDQAPTAIFYKITKLSNTQMWWEANSNGDNSIIRFKRRTDI